MKRNFLPRFVALCISLTTVTTLFSQTKTVFNFTGSDQSYVVPAGVTQVTVKAWGAGGAGGNYVYNDIGGGGGFVTGIINVTPGETLKIMVGEGGGIGEGPSAYGGGGAKEGGVGGLGGRGGGRSAVINSIGQELITAGAGGGGGGVAAADNVGGHGGGGLTGEPDGWVTHTGIPLTEPVGGGPGTQTSGGVGGVQPFSNCTCGSNPGSLHQGGTAGKSDNGFNGSGGGGYYGGGSGTDVGDGAGGGGSSFVPPGGSTTSAVSDVPGNIADADYANLAGYGGKKATVGNPGRVVLIVNNIIILPKVFVFNSSVIEGDVGSRKMAFIFTLNKRSSSPVSVHYQTLNMSAVATQDYVATSGNLQFPPYVQFRIVYVPVIGDMTPEKIESFRMNLSSPVNAILGNAKSSGFIFDNDRRTGTTSVLDNSDNFIEPELSVVALQNPARNNFKLIVTGNDKEQIQIRVVDVLGKLVQTINKANTDVTVQFGASWKPGIYFAEVMQGKNRKVIRLVKAN